MSQTYEIKLPQFEGPFDLLLFFIERDELDVYNIPISKITQDFLDYIHQMSVMNIELASEFIVVAATLMRIKAKLLLPRKDIDEAGNEIDPRQELINKLLEYKRYKEVLDDMRSLEDNRAGKFERGNLPNELKSLADSFSGEAELHTLSLFKLMKAFEKVMARYEEEKSRPIHQVIQYAYTIQGSRERIIDITKNASNVAFEKIFELCDNRIHAIFTFLAMLELIQERLLSINTGIGSNNFWVSSSSTEEAA
jgi:segregation and condensation protein A